MQILFFITHKRKIIWLFLISVGVLFLYWSFPPCFLDKFFYFCKFITNKKHIESFILLSGQLAPVVFMSLQIVQVVVAPIPGEIMSFIGGYLFGTFAGFLYSSFSLTMGSWILFCIGRFFGEKHVEFLIPSERINEFSQLFNQFIVFFCFIFPGFPKDYLCLFLGLTNIPTKRFLFLSGVGRMPGTFFLSLQGSAVFENNYYFFLICMAIMVLLILVSFKYKDRIYDFLAKLN